MREVGTEPNFVERETQRPGAFAACSAHGDSPSFWREQREGLRKGDMILQRGARVPESWRVSNLEREHKLRDCCQSMTVGGALLN